MCKQNTFYGYTMWLWAEVTGYIFTLMIFLADPSLIKWGIRTGPIPKKARHLNVSCVEDQCAFYTFLSYALLSLITQMSHYFGEQNYSWWTASMFVLLGFDQVIFKRLLFNKCPEFSFLAVQNFKVLSTNGRALWWYCVLRHFPHIQYSVNYFALKSPIQLSGCSVLCAD